MSSGILKLIEVSNLEYVENPTSHSFAISKYKTFRKNLAFVLFGVPEKFLARAPSQNFLAIYVACANYPTSRTNFKKYKIVFRIRKNLLRSVFCSCFFLYSHAS